MQVGDIAVCQKGYTGLITRVKSNAIGGSWYEGIHLSRNRFGQHWQSVRPTIIGNIYDVLESIEETESRT